MTPRQRWESLLAREQPDRIPTDYWATTEFHAKLKRHLGIEADEQLWRRLHVDRPRSVAPRCRVKSHPDDPQANIWGVRHERISYGTGAYLESSHHPLAEAETAGQVHAFRWPQADWFDYSSISQALAADDRFRPIVGGTYEPFLLYCKMRGLERGFEDLLANPEVVEAGLERIFQFHYEHLRRSFEAGDGRIDWMYLAEDLGGQTGPLMSLDAYRRFLLPNQKRMADLARSYGVRIFYHTDGSARPFLPDLIDAVGIDLLNPIQWRCPGMEREGLVRDFGRRIIFHGAMDNQQTLPFGSIEDVVEEVRQNAEIFRGSRWICAPCHNIQAVTPVENIVAMYRAVHEIGQPVEV